VYNGRKTVNCCLSLSLRFEQHTGQTAAEYRLKTAETATIEHCNATNSKRVKRDWSALGHVVLATVQPREKIFLPVTVNRMHIVVNCCEPLYKPPKCQHYCSLQRAQCTGERNL